MAGEISIYATFRENISQGFKTIANASKYLTKDVETLKGQLETIEKKKSILSIDTQAAQKAVKDAGKAYLEAKAAVKEFEKTGDSLSLAKAQAELKKNKEVVNQTAAEYIKLQSEMDGLKRETKEVNGQLSVSEGLMSKAQNRAGGGIMGDIASAVAIQMGGQVASQWANLIAGSAGGSELGTLFSGALSGAASGAAIGSLLPVPGASLIGAGFGGMVGTAQAVGTIAGSRDESFKSVVQSQYDNTKNESQQTLMAGSAIASQREIDQISFTNLLGGEGIAQEYLAWVKTTANNTPFLYEDLTRMSKTLATYQYTPEEMQKRLIQIGDTGADLGWSTSDSEEAAKALGRMKSSGKTTLEYLNILNDRGVPAIDYLAKALGKSNGEIYNMVSKGLIPGADAATIIADKMGEVHLGAMDLQSKTYSGLMSNLEGAQQEEAASQGVGYNGERSKGIQAELEWRNGLSPEKLEEVNEMIGAYQASLVNEQEAMYRKSREAAFKLIEEQNLDGAEAGKVLEKARVEAENNYRKTEGYQIYQQTEKELVGMLQNDLADGWENFGYTMGQAFTKGLWSTDYKKALDPQTAKDGGIISAEEIDSISSYASGVIASKSGKGRGAPLAMGLQYVPYDDFPARLHEGEWVLTAAEARSSIYRQPPAVAVMSGGGESSISVNVTGNAFSVREEADVYRIAQEIAEEIRRFVEVS